MKFLIILILIVCPTFGWQYFTSVKDAVLIGSIPEHRGTHSTYQYGICPRDEIMYYTHLHMDHLEVLGKKIIRGWIEVLRIPTCILLKGTSYETDLFRNTLYGFQFCVPRITYCHSQARLKYHYFEWYIPIGFSGGMDWDIYFYGPKSATWQ